SWIRTASLSPAMIRGTPVTSIRSRLRDRAFANEEDSGVDKTGQYCVAGWRLALGLFKRNNSLRQFRGNSGWNTVRLSILLYLPEGDEPASSPCREAEEPDGRGPLNTRTRVSSPSITVVWA